MKLTHQSPFFRKKKQYTFASLAVLVLVLMFVSCASRSAVNENRIPVYLTNDTRYILLPPGDIEQPIDMAQYISASYNGQDYFFNSWVRADETGMEITLFNELGAAMGELSYRDGHVQFSSPVFPRSLKSEYIVADFQLCFYDPLLLRGALENCGLTFETDRNTRRILKGKNIIIEINKDINIVKIQNYVRGYSYTLEGDF